MELTRRAFSFLSALVPGWCYEPPPDPWETRKLVKVYTPLTDSGTMFRVNGELVPEVFRAEVFSDGFARLHTYVKPGTGIALDIEANPYGDSIVTHVLECFPEIDPVPCPPLVGEVLSEVDALTLDWVAETLEIPAKDGWRRYVAGRVFACDFATMDIGLVLSEPRAEHVRVYWLSPNSREYEEGFISVLKMYQRRNTPGIRRRWQAQQARQDAEDLNNKGGES